jgi:endonuclease/exonuclease/phosphatase family metal-dependent hydrolase
MFSAKLLVLLILPLSAILTNSQKTNAPNNPVSQISSEAEASLLESGTPTKLRQIGLKDGEIKIVSYNIRYRSGDDLKKLLKLLREDPEIGNAMILGLQEVDRHKKRTDQTNTARTIADNLGLNYAWAAPPPAKPTDEEETGVAIMTPFPMSDIRRLVLPHEGPNQRRRVALGATVRINGKDIRVYSMHGETRIDMDKKIEQMGTLIQDLKQYPEDLPVVVVGDLNTWEASAAAKTIKLFSGAGFHTPFGSQTTFSRRVFLIPIEFRLDWVWLRGMRVVTYGIDRKINLSDHFPLWANVKLPAEKETGVQQR